MDQHTFILGNVNLKNCTRMGLLSHIIAIIMVSSFIGFTIVSDTEKHNDFNYVDGLVLDLQAKSDMLYRETFRTVKKWKQQDQNFNKLGYHGHEFDNTATASSKPDFDIGQLIMDDEYIVFSKYHQGRRIFNFGIRGYRWDSGVLMATQKKVTGILPVHIRESKKNPYFMAQDHIKVRIYKANAIIEYGFFIFMLPETGL